MNRWRWYLGILVLLSLALWIALFAWNLRPEFVLGIAHPPFSIPDAGRFRMPLTGLPVWVSLPATFISFFLAGVGILYTFPARVRRIKQSITVSVIRFFQVTMLGFGISLLFFGFEVNAVLSKITFPLTIIIAFLFFLLAVGGFVAVAYSVGSKLLQRAGWSAASPFSALALGLLLLLPMQFIPLIGGLFMIFLLSIGLGAVITTRFGSGEPWNLIPLLEDEKE